MGEIVEASRPLSAAELDALKVLWERGPVPVRGVLDALAADRDWAYTTAKTILDRLVEKGYVRRDRRVRPYVYHPTVTREQVVAGELATLRDDVCDGEFGPLLRALIGEARPTADEIRELRDYLDALDSEDDAR
ncbi:MAG: BlaI/MecI/CopY family transcriptional regulator [Gemmatimonadota bacterium]